MEETDEEVLMTALQGFVPLLRFLEDNFPTPAHAIITCLLVLKYIVAARPGAPSLPTMVDAVMKIKFSQVAKDALVKGVNEILVDLESKLGKKPN